MDKDFISSLLGGSTSELKAFVNVCVCVLYPIISLVWTLISVWILNRILPPIFTDNQEVLLVYTIELLSVLIINKLIGYAIYSVLTRMYRSSLKYFENKLSA